MGKKRKLPPGARDFDFLIGEWRVHNRRLKERLVGYDEWEEFEATLSVRPILDGLGNVDQFKATLDGRYFEGVTLRAFNPETEEWSLHWIDNVGGVLHPPVVGSFRDGRGTFFARDRHLAQPVLVRFVWTDVREGSARWEQAFSVDDGRTWETNWVMEFTRA